MFYDVLMFITSDLVIQGQHGHFVVASRPLISLPAARVWLGPLPGSTKKLKPCDAQLAQLD